MNVWKIKLSATDKDGSVSNKDILKLKVIPRSQVGNGKSFAVKRKRKICPMMYIILMVRFRDNSLENTIQRAMLKLVSEFFIISRRT